MAVQTVTVPERAQSLSGTPRWLQAGEVPVYAVLHSPAPADRQNTAVLILPPFGWEEVCSYRSRRSWAIELAQAGFVAARIDLPATGDSGGVASDLDMLDRWDVAARGAVDWLRGLGGITRVAVIGIRLGGLLAVRALAGGAPVDDLVLWGVPAHGSTYLRELRVHSSVVAISSHEQDDGRVNSDGTLTLTGFAVKPATVAALEAVDLTALPLPDLNGRRALLIERDRLGVDRDLTAALNGAGVQTQTQMANDYRLLMSGPLEAGTPHESIANTIDWLNAAAGLADPSPDGSGAPGEEVEETGTMVVDGVTLTERLFGYDGRAGRMVGVLTKPADQEPLLPVCVVLLAPGRRIGPNRMWVETARRWAAVGVQAVRVDIEGLGDSDGDGDRMIVEEDLYAPRMTENVTELLDRLAEMGVADRFVMVGLCSSAYWSFRAALEDPRIIGTTLVNQWSFGVGDHRAERGLRRLAWRPGSEEARRRRSVRIWLSALTAKDTDVAMIFSMQEPLYEQIVRFGYTDRRDESPNLFIEQTPVRDRNFRAPWAQAVISARIDAAIRRQLGCDSGPNAKARSLTTLVS